MQRTKITLELNLDEATLLGAALIHVIREGWGDNPAKAKFPTADWEHLLEQVAIMRNIAADNF